MSDRLKGRNVLVTGAATGVGRGIAVEAARQGANVAVLYRERPPDTTLADIADLGSQAFAIRGDVSDEADVVRLYEELDERLGRIDGLVNNAAAFGYCRIVDMTADEWDRLQRTNVRGYMLMAREAARRMMRQRAADPQWSGKIVNISSTGAYFAIPGLSAYCATKAAIINLTMGLATELAPHGVHANCVVPGHIETDTHDAGAEFVMEKLNQRIPLGRRGSCREMGRVVAFFLSDDSDYVTGSTLRVDGGLWSYHGPAGYVDDRTIWGDSPEAVHNWTPPPA